jgi:hypothetical protein
MERAIAIKKLGKLLGKSLGYRVDPNAPLADEREELRATLKEASTKVDALLKQKELRIKALLDADAEFQRIKAEHATAKKARDRLASRCYHYRFTVGTNDGLFFVVKAQGDSWEEVIGKVEGGHSLERLTWQG